MFINYISHISHISRYLLVFLFFKASMLHAFDLVGNKIHVEEVLPLFNLHEKKVYVSPDEKGINPAVIDLPDAVKSVSINNRWKVKGFIGDIVFKDLILKTDKQSIDVKLVVNNVSDNKIKIIPRLVTSWYQSGFTTTQKKFSGVLTYELLLSDDKNFVINDKWIKSRNGGWVYVPPDIKLSETLHTTLSPDTYKRILLKISLGSDVLPGKYTADFEIITYREGTKKSISLPLEIEVLPVKLTSEDQGKYKILLYTAFKLNGQPDRSGSYVNAMRLDGSEEEKESLMFAYLTDIREHGFNGITIHDWDSVSLEKTLNMTSKLGFKYIVLHATTPVSSKYKGMKNPVVSEAVKKIFNKYNTVLYYYGYDEVGGNKVLDKQLKLNQDIHAINGKSVNAVFWDDMTNVTNVIGKDKSKCFDVIAHSMGSHGQIEMYESLPYTGRDDYCSKLGAEYLTYWHPHVENPVINRIFSGFWLWASGFDGVIPHGYYFPSHIEKVLSEDDIKRGVSNITSPYDDWSFWLPGNPLRHHNSVYPSKNGPIGTLQWEGVLSGNVDLKYIMTLENKLDSKNLDKLYKDKIAALLNEIRADVLKIKSPYMDDKKSLKYLIKLETWKKDIRALLLH